MTPKTAFITLLVLVACVPFAGAQSSDEGARGEAIGPGSFHLSSFDSELAGRFSMDGSLDSGAVIFEWLDGLSGEPLRAEYADLGVGPSLNVRWTSTLGRQKVVGFGLAGSLSSGSDRRLLLAQQLEIRNETDEEQRVQLVGRLRSGDGDANQRPYPSLAHQDGESWALEGERFIVRNGLVVATWVGSDPDVEVVSHPGSGAATAARLVWNFTVQPGKSSWLEVLLAGAPAEGAPEELGWRGRFRRKSYGALEDVRRWEAMYHGQFGSFVSADDRLRNVMITGVHVLRSLGDAHYQIGSLSDRPFGHPASDAAVEAEILGTFFEYGLNQISEQYLDTLMAGLYDRAGPLPLERKVAYLHGLSRALRLAGDTSRDGGLGGAILELMSGGGPDGWAEPWHDGDVAVSPWFDPDQVRADLGAILTRAGLEGADELPRLAWAPDQEPGSAAADMLATRKALAARDSDRAWKSFAKLLDRTTRVGLGAMEPGGTMDGRFALGITALARDFLVDDHGPDLHIFPGLCSSLLKVGMDVKTSWLPTAFGQLQAQAFYTGKNQLGGWVTLRTGTPPARTILHFPPETVLRKVKMQHGEGQIDILEPSNKVELGLLPGRGLRFNVTARRNPKAEQSG